MITLEYISFYLPMSKITISKPNIPDDVYQIADLFFITWLATYPNKETGITEEDIKERFKDRHSKESIQKRVDNLSALSKNQSFFVAKDEEKIIGVCRAVIRDNYNQLQSIYVLPEYQGKGVGYQLWQEAKKFFDSKKQTVVQVATYNTKAITFYKKLGFVDTGKRFTNEKHRMPISKAVILEMEMTLVSKEILDN